MTDQNRQEPRLNTVHDLFRFAIEHPSTDSSNQQSDGPTANRTNPLDPERRRFLEQALLANTVDVAEELKKGISTLDRFLNEDDECDEDKALETVDLLLQYVGQIDFARDFLTLGGYSVLTRMYEHQSDEIKVAAFDLTAELLQNNPSTQQTTSSNGLIDYLLRRLAQDDLSSTVKVKMVYCLSSMLRGNDDGIQKFSQSNGLDILVRLLQTQWTETRLCTKISFLLHSLCAASPQLQTEVLQRQLIDVFVTILQQPTCPAHEFVLDLLQSACHESARFVQECRRPELNLQTVLANVLSLCSGKEEYLELESAAKALQDVCFGVQTTEESER